MRKLVVQNWWAEGEIKTKHKWDRSLKPLDKVLLKFKETVEIWITPVTNDLELKRAASAPQAMFYVFNLALTYWGGFRPGTNLLWKLNKGRDYFYSM